MRMRIMTMTALAALTLVVWTPAPARAQMVDAGQEMKDAQEPFDEQPVDEQSAEAADSEMKPTEIGVRFTPRMAYAMGGAFAREMKGRYELTDEQVDSVRDIFATRLMKTVTENAENGRDALELMMETMIENNGRFTKEAAQKFAKQVKPLVPAFKEFFIQSAGDIGKKMNVKQKLKFSADVAAATAGFAVFENRMARWEEGKVGDNANPFWDPVADDPAATQPAQDPNETKEHREVRLNVENQLRWELDVETRWTTYVDQAIEFYGFDEAQTNSAKGILKDILERLKAVKTPEWRQSIKENRMAQNLCWRVNNARYVSGPVQFRLETQYDQLSKPLFDLGKELKRRIEDLPTTAQRAKAMENVKKAFAEKGMEKLPL